MAMRSRMITSGIPVDKRRRALVVWGSAAVGFAAALAIAIFFFTPTEYGIILGGLALGYCLVQVIDILLWVPR